MLEPSNNALLPEIPSKRYFTIGEVSELCDVKPHVLRYWEQEFPQLKPVKRRGNRRYYQRQDVVMIRQIRSLLYEQGYTIGGARLQLQEQRPEREGGDVVVDTAVTSGLAMASGDGMVSVLIQDMIAELEQVVLMLAP